MSNNTDQLILHNNQVQQLIHWTLCCKCDLSRSEKWYDHQQDGVVENEHCYFQRVNFTPVLE